MSEIRINKKFFEISIFKLKDALKELEQYNKSFFDDLIDSVDKSKTEFTDEYKNSMELVKKEWNDNLIEELQDLSKKCDAVSIEFENIDITISDILNQGGSF